MAGLTRSYVHGASDVPLIGQTLGEYFDGAVARFPDADALVARQQKVRLDLSPAAAARRRLRRRTARPRPRARRPRRHLVAQQRRVADHPVRHRQGRSHPGEHQSVLSAGRARIRAQQGRLQGADHGDRAQDQRLHRHAEPAGAGADVEQAGRAEGRKAAGAAIPRADRRQVAGHVRLRRDRRPCQRQPSHPAEGSRRPAAVRRSHQHPVHQRHDRIPQGSDAHPPQHPQQRLLHRRDHAAHREGPHLHPGAALSLLRHGARQPRLRHSRLRHDLSRRGLRSPGRAGDRRGRTLHRPLRRAHHVHRRVRPCRVQALRPLAPCAPASWRARPVRPR